MQSKINYKKDEKPLAAEKYLAKVRVGRSNRLARSN